MAIQITYMLRYWTKALRRDGKNDPQESVPEESVSVVICARDEEQGLRRSLPPLLNQDYPDYEVVVVDDCSADGTAEYLESLREEYPRLKISRLDIEARFRRGKKLALLIGIKGSSGSIILVTGAGSVPVSPDWIRLMASRIAGEREVVLGYGAYRAMPGLLNRYIRYESLMTAFQYLGMARAGKPYMGVGRNMGYRRPLFLSHNGFSRHYHIAAGDDTLFVNGVATDSNVACQTDPASHTRSEPATTTAAFLKQKIGNIKTLPFFKKGDRIRMAAEPATRFLFYSAAILIASFGYGWTIAAAAVAARSSLLIAIFAIGSKRFGEKGILLPLLIFDAIYPLLNGVIYFGTALRKRRKGEWR